MQRKIIRIATGTIGSVMCLAISGLAFAQAITFADLEGHAVVADIHREQAVQKKGKRFSVRMHQNWKFYVNDEHMIVFTVNTTVKTPKGTRKTKPNSSSFALDEMVKVKSRGGGHAGWSFADGTLTFTRTFPAGAYRAHFAFAQKDGRMTCSVGETFAREGGKGAIRIESAFGGQVTILKSTQLPSNCKVSKKK
ncbi:MAG: hypothetical protein ACRECO_07645 [Xanthobacteraceae bacterium]